MTAFIIPLGGTLAVMQSAADVLDYGFDHRDLLTGGDTVVSSVWTKTGAVTLGAEAVDGAVCTVFVAGTSGSVTNAVITDQGRRKTITFCVLPEPPSSCLEI